MSALEESLESQGLPEWDSPWDSAAVTMGLQTEGEAMADIYPEGME